LGQAQGKLAVHGCKAHVSADADTALVEEVAITPANVNDGQADPHALSDGPGDVLADSAYRGGHFETAARAKDRTPRIVATGVPGAGRKRDLGAPHCLEQTDPSGPQPDRKNPWNVEALLRPASRAGADLQRPPFRSASPPLPRTSNAFCASSPARRDGDA